MQTARLPRLAVAAQIRRLPAADADAAKIAFGMARRGARDPHFTGFSGKTKCPEDLPV